MRGIRSNPECGTGPTRLVQGEHVMLVSDKTAVRLLATAFIAGGVWFAGGVLSGGYGLLVLGVFGVLAGRGLLRGREFWHQMAAFVATIGLVFSLGAAVFLILEPPDQVRLLDVLPLDVSAYGILTFPVPSYTILILPALSLAFWSWVAFVLHRPAIREHFAEGRPVTAGDSGWWRVILAVLLVFEGGVLVTNHCLHEYLARLDCHEVTVRLLDQQTEEPIRTYQGPAILFGERSFPRYSVTISRDDDGGVRLHIRWIGVGPLELPMDAIGYKPKPVEFPTGHFGEPIDVYLQRDPTEEPPGGWPTRRPTATQSTSTQPLP